MITQIRPTLSKADLWKSSFERFKPLIMSHVPIARLSLAQSPTIFINEAELLAKDDEALLLNKTKHTQIDKGQQPQKTNQTVQIANKAKDVVLMKKPVEPQRPDPGDCCGDGCKVCVFDRYYTALEKYEEDLNKWNALQTAQGIDSTDSIKNGISHDQNLSALDW